jgi:hypothetical protein
VYHPAVATGLVRREPVLFLEKRDVGVGAALEELTGDGDTEDATTDDGDAVGSSTSASQQR